MKKVKIEESWKKVLSKELEKPYFKALSGFVRQEYLGGSVFPRPLDVFRAFDLCPFDKVNVVILGQDPYHGIDQANGLSFAVNEGVRIPPSLQNIFKEVQGDLGVTLLPSGDLSRWASQGVLLLNATLTVRENSPGSHQDKGWEEFTDAVIQKLSDEKENLVFILWGNYAKQKGKVIDRSKHLVLESQHPSPFSARNGFFGSRPFSKSNDFLRNNGKKEINWE